MSVLVEFNIKPIDKGESVGDYVARCAKIIDESGLPYQLHAMGTTLEGEWQDCFEVVQACYRALEEDCDRISCNIHVDARKGLDDRLETKVDTVQSQVGRPLQR